MDGFLTVSKMTDRIILYDVTRGVRVDETITICCGAIKYYLYLLNNSQEVS